MPHGHRALAHRSDCLASRQERVGMYQSSGRCSQPWGRPPACRTQPKHPRSRQHLQALSTKQLPGLRPHTTAPRPFSRAGPAVFLPPGASPLSLTGQLPAHHQPLGHRRGETGGGGTLRVGSEAFRLPHEGETGPDRRLLSAALISPARRRAERTRPRAPRRESRGSATAPGTAGPGGVLPALKDSALVQPRQRTENRSCP